MTKFKIETLARRYGWRKITYELCRDYPDNRPFYITSYFGKHDDYYRASPNTEYSDDEIAEIVLAEYSREAELAAWR